MISPAIVKSTVNNSMYAAAAAKSLQSYPILCDPTDGSPPGSAVPGILQARTLEWVAISFSNAWKWKVKVKSLSRVQIFMIPWTAAHQAPPSMAFSRQEYWSGGGLLRIICIDTIIACVCIPTYYQWTINAPIYCHSLIYTVSDLASLIQRLNDSISSIGSSSFSE